MSCLRKLRLAFHSFFLHLRDWEDGQLLSLVRQGIQYGNFRLPT